MTTEPTDDKPETTATGPAPFAPVTCSALPAHHLRYATAWSLYQDELSENSRRALEREMDSAQNEFSWNEFQAFKATLPGYVGFWKKLAASLMPNASDELPRAGGNKH